MPCRSRTSFNSHPYPVGADVVAHALRIAVATLCDDRVGGFLVYRQHHRAPRCCAASADPQVQRHRLNVPSWLLTLDCQPHGVVVQVVIVATTRALASSCGVDVACQAERSENSIAHGHRRVRYAAFPHLHVIDSPRRPLKRILSLAPDRMQRSLRTCARPLAV